MRYNRNMRFFLLISLFLSLGISLANAQELAIPQQGEKEERTIDEELGITKEEEKEKSTGDIKKDYSLKFFDECKKTTHPMISAESRQLLCACTAQDMQKEMDYGDIVALFTDEQKAPGIYREILRTHYAGCSRHVVRDTSYDLCIGTDALKKYRKEKAVCDCLSDTMARFMTQKGAFYIDAELSRNPGNYDPLGTYLESNTYKERYHVYLDRCIEIHVWGYR